jgi:hypothetical protein
VAAGRIRIDRFAAPSGARRRKTTFCTRRWTPPARCASASSPIRTDCLRSEALDYLRGSDAIIHAGDIGTMHVLDALRTLAPVHAVRGNNDGGEWAAAFPIARSSASAIS